MVSAAAVSATAGPEPRATAGGEDFNVAAHGLRGVASMMVLFAHLLGGTAEHIYHADRNYVSAVLPFWNIGTFGVQLFFVISGFVILPSVRRYSLGEFGLRRFLRLYPLFLAFSLLFAALNYFTGAYPKLNTVTAFVSGLLFLNLFTGTEQLTPNAWSLSFEVMFYLATAITYYCAFTRRSVVLTIVSLLLSLAFWVQFPISSYFALGLLVRVLHDRGLVLPLRLARSFEAVMLGVAIWLASLSHYEYRWADLANPAVPPLIVATATYFYLAVHRNSLTALLLNNRPTLYLGTVSYSLYIVHPYIYLPTRLAFARLGWFTEDTVLSLTIFALVVTPLALIATAIVHDRLERWPYTRFFRQGIYRRRAAASGADERRSRDSVG